MTRNEFKAILNRQDMSDVDRKKLLEGFDEQSNVTDKINIIDVEMLTAFPECVYTYDFSTVNDNNFKDWANGDLDYSKGPLNIQGLLNAQSKEEYKIRLYNTIKDLYNVKNDPRITIAYCKNKNDIKSIIRYDEPNSIIVYINEEEYIFHCFAGNNLNGQYSKIYGSHPNFYFYIGILADLENPASGKVSKFEDLDLSKCYITYCIDFIPHNKRFDSTSLPSLKVDATWNINKDMFDTMLYSNRIAFNLGDNYMYKPISYYCGNYTNPYVLIFYDYAKNKHIKVSITMTRNTTKDYVATCTVTNIEEL